MTVNNSYSREIKCHYRLFEELTKGNPCVEVIHNNFQKTCNLFYFENTLLALLHLFLIKRYPSKSHDNTKI